MQNTKTESIRQAQLLIDQGRLAAAISIYQKIVDTDSGDLSAISVLSDLYVRAGRIPEASEHFARIAETYVRNGSAISAVYILNKVLRLDPENARAHMNLGEVYAHEGKNEQAHDSFIEAGAAFWHKGNMQAALKMNERALACVPNSRQAKTALSLLEHEMGQPEVPPAPKAITGELEPIFISISDDGDEMIVSRRSQADQAADQSAAEVSLAPAQDEREPEVPQDSLSAPEIEHAQNEDLIVEHIAKAELMVAYGQADQAVVLLRETLHHKPDHIQIREKLKDIYLRCGMVDRASEECLNIAGIYAARGDSVRSRDHVIRARLLSDPDDPIALLSVMQESGVEGADQRAAELEWPAEPRQEAAVM